MEECSRLLSQLSAAGDEIITFCASTTVNQLVLKAISAQTTKYVLVDTLPCT